MMWKNGAGRKIPYAGELLILTHQLLFMHIIFIYISLILLDNAFPLALGLLIHSIIINHVPSDHCQ